MIPLLRFKGGSLFVLFCLSALACERASESSDSRATDEVVLLEEHVAAEVEPELVTEAIKVMPAIARIQTFVAEAESFESLEFLVGPPCSDRAEPLEVEVRSSDLSHRFGRGEIEPFSCESRYDWRAVQWTERPTLNVDEKYAFVVFLNPEAVGDWTVALGNSYVWGELKPYTISAWIFRGHSKDGTPRFDEPTITIEYRDLGFRATFEGGTSISSGIKRSERRPALLPSKRIESLQVLVIRRDGTTYRLPTCEDDSSRCVNPPARTRTSFFRSYRRGKKRAQVEAISNMKWFVNRLEDSVLAIDVEAASSANYPVAVDFEAIDVFHDYALFRRGDVWMTLDLQDGGRYQKTIADCEFAEPLPTSNSVMIACFQNDLLRLHDLPSEEIVQPPFLPETYRYGPLRWVGDSLHLLGQHGRYTWRMGSTEWKERGPAVSFHIPDRDLADYIEELHEIDADLPGFIGRVYFHATGLRYDLDTKDFSKADVSPTLDRDITSDFVRFGPYLLHESGELRHVAPRRNGGTWVGRHFVFRECNHDYSPCVRGSNGWGVEHLSDLEYFRHSLDFRPVDVTGP